jgi:proton-dependent oligopeptide transporter, POT family
MHAAPQQRRQSQHCAPSDLTIAHAGSLGHLVTTAVLGVISLAALGLIGWALRAFSRKQIDIVIVGYAVVFMGVLAAATGYAAYAAGLGGQTYAFTAAMTQSFNPGFVVLLASPVAALWISLAKRGWEPSTPVKFGLALLLVGLGFFVLVAGVRFADPGTFRVPLIFLLLLYLFHTTGELFLSPVGLSMITKLSAAKVVGLMMGVWFLASSLAHILAAQIASTTGAETVAGQVLDPAAQLERYQHVFSQVGWWGLIAGGAVLALSPLLAASGSGSPRPASPSSMTARSSTAAAPSPRTMKGRRPTAPC